MKRTLAIATIALAGMFAFAPAARADNFGVSFGFGVGFRGGHIQGVYRHGGYRHGRSHRHRRHHRIYRHRPVHVHVRRPVYRQVWVAPVYQSVIVGYDRHHHPIYSSVIVRPGYYRTVVRGHSCASCGISLHL